MLRRRFFVSSAVSAVVVNAVRFTSKSYDVSGQNKDSDATATVGHHPEKSSSGAFSFKNSINAQRLSTGKKTDAGNSSPSAAEERQTQAKVNQQQQRQRAPFVNMLNNLHSNTAAAVAGGASSSAGSHGAASTGKAVGGFAATTHGQSSSSSSATPEERKGGGGILATIASLRPSNLIGNRKADLEKDRKARLVFRDESGGSLDKFSITDPLLFFKYARFGLEYAADTELERRLRYYKEHASREILTSDGGKLMRGPPHLFPLKASGVSLGAAGSATNSNIGIKGFVASSLSAHPNAPSKTRGASSAATVEGITPIASDLANDPSAATSTMTSSSTNTGYIPTSNPATTNCLRLPRIVTSNMAQFMPAASAHSSTKGGMTTRVNGAYKRAYLAVDDVAKESRVAGGSSVEGDADSSSTPQTSTVSFLTKDSTQHVFNGANFRRPAMLVISQLGIKIGAEENNAWCCSALKYLEPNSPFITVFDDSCNSGNVYGRNIRNLASVTKSGSDATIRQDVLDDRLRAQALVAEQTGVSASEILEATEEAKMKRKSSTETGAKNTAAAGGKPPAPLKRPIDLYCLRTVDLYDYKFMHRILVRRFAKSLTALDKELMNAVQGSGANTSPYLYGSVDSIASNTFVGLSLLKNFFPEPFCLRNYIGTTVLLVDHKGRVRWVSGGKPDEQERELVPRLLRDLESEYLAALSGGASK